MHALSNIFGAKQFCYIYPYMSEGIDTSHEYDEMYDLGGNSLIPILTTNIKAKKYIFVTSSMVIKRMYDNLGKIKLDKNNFYRIADAMNVHNNRLVVSFCNMMHSKYGKVRVEPNNIENILYYSALFEYICRPSFRMLPYITLLNSHAEYNAKIYDTEEEVENKSELRHFPKLWRILTDIHKEMIWNELVRMDKLMRASTKKIDIVYMKAPTLYKTLLDNEIYKKNVCFVSVFDISIEHSKRHKFRGNDICTSQYEFQMLAVRKKRMELLYNKCTEYGVPFVFSTVYKLGKKIYQELDDFINDNKIQYRMYVSTHNKAHLMIAGNVSVIKKESNIDEEQLNYLWKV